MFIEHTCILCCSCICGLQSRRNSANFLQPIKTYRSIRPVIQNQPPGDIPRKRCSEYMQQIYRRTPMSKCDFNKFIEITLRHGYSPVNLLHIFRTPFPKNTSERLLLINVHCRKFKHEGVKQNLALRVKIMSKYPRGEFHPSLQDRGKIKVGLRFYFGWACIQKDKFDQRQGWNSPQGETTCNVP